MNKAVSLVLSVEVKSTPIFYFKISSIIRNSYAKMKSISQNGFSHKPLPTGWSMMGWSSMVLGQFHQDLSLNRSYSIRDQFSLLLRAIN